MKLVVALVASMICTGEFSCSMGAILPHELMGAGGHRVSQSDKPCGGFLLQHHQGSHQYPSLPGHCYSGGTEQPTAMDSAFGW